MLTELREMMIRQFALQTKLIDEKLSQQAELIDEKIRSAICGLTVRVDGIAMELEAIKEENKRLRDLVLTSTHHLPHLQPIVSPILSTDHAPGIPTTAPQGKHPPCHLDKHPLPTPHHPPSEAVKSIYHITRRTVRLLPVSLHPDESATDAARRFLVEKMLMPKDIAQRIAIDNVDLIAVKHRFGGMESTVQALVVRFPTATTRDMLNQFCRNLSPGTLLQREVVMRESQSARGRSK